MSTNSSNPKTPRPPTPYERIKDQLAAKTLECELLQSANDGLGAVNRDLNTRIDSQRTTLRQMDLSGIRAHCVARISAAQTSLIAVLDQPWYRRNKGKVVLARRYLTYALDALAKFDADPNPNAPDSPGSIMGLTPRDAACEAQDTINHSGGLE